MPGEVITAVVNDWARVCEEVQQRCAELLGPFAEALEDIGAPVDPDDLSASPADGGGIEEKFKHDYFTMFRSAAGGGMMVMGVTGMASLVLPAAAAATFTAVMPWVAIPALVVLAGSGIKGALGGQVKGAQQQLTMQLAEQLQKVRRHFLDVDLGAGSFSRVDEYFRTLERTVNEQVREMVEKKSKEAQAEIAVLQETTQLDDHEREARTRQAQEQLAQWDNIGKYAKQVTAQIEALKRPKAPAKA